MAGKNRDPKYIKKLLGLSRNGYKFDLANYLYNPAFGYEYPRFKKIIAEDDLTATYRDVYYFKYFGGTGAYMSEEYTVSKSGEGTVRICQNRHETTLEESNRFSLNKLLEFCE